MNGAGAGHGCLLRCSTSAGNNENRSIGHDWLRASDRTVFLLVLPLLPLVSSLPSVTCVTIFLSTVSIAAYCFLSLSLFLCQFPDVEVHGESARWFLFFLSFTSFGHLRFAEQQGAPRVSVHGCLAFREGCWRANASRHQARFLRCGVTHGVQRAWHRTRLAERL